VKFSIRIDHGESSESYPTINPCLRMNRGLFIILESYVQLKDELGQIDFIVMNSEKLPYTGPTSTIKALEPLQWRKP